MTDTKAEKAAAKKGEAQEAARADATEAAATNADNPAAKALRAAQDALARAEQERDEALAQLKTIKEGSAETKEFVEELTIETETDYITLGREYGLPFPHELAAFNGVANASYALHPGDVVRFPKTPVPKLERKGK